MHRKFGTVVGATLAGSIGRFIDYRNSASDHPPGGRKGEPGRMFKRRNYRAGVMAYRVSYRYHGRHCTTKMPYDPGARIPVRIDVEPAGWYLTQ